MDGRKAQIDKLTSSGPVLTDGAWGTQFQTGGLALRRRPDFWNLEHPERVAAVAAGFISAGSRILLTNTFGANRYTLSSFGWGDSSEQILRAGVRISRDAAGESTLVFGSIGPCVVQGASLLSDDELLACCTEQSAILADAGADALVLETMLSKNDALIMLKAARQTGLPVVACFTYNGAGSNACRSIAGEPLDEVTAALADAGADVIGANCGDGIEEMLVVCRHLRQATKLPIWMKPNAGLPIETGGLVRYSLEPAQFARHAMAMVNEGANFIGGCCGTGPEHIRALAEALKGSVASLCEDTA